MSNEEEVVQSVPRRDEGTPVKKKSKKWRYILYMAIVLIVTIIVFVYNINQTGFRAILNAFYDADVWLVLLVFGISIFSYLVDALIVFVFARLYTKKYKMHQAVANVLVGQFYSNVTPGASGGQPLQVYTMKTQGMQASSAASVFVMWFILYQFSLCGFDIVAIIVEWNSISSISAIAITLGEISFEIPMIVMIVIGFGLNLSLIFLLLFMSYSHWFHNLILHHVLGFLGKIHLLKNVDKMRASLRAQVENFKIELKRLSVNFPILILQVVLFLVVIFCRYSIPYFSGLALHAFDQYWTDSFFDATTQSVTTIYTLAQEGVFDWRQMLDMTFLCGFHQMVTGVLGFIPGNVGISEWIYSTIYYNIYNFENARNPNLALTSTQIMWRLSTFYMPLIVSGIVASLYHSKAKGEVPLPSMETYVTMQIETYEERKASVEAMLETSQFSLKKIQRRVLQKQKEDDMEIPITKPEIMDYVDISDVSSNKPKKKKIKPVKKNKPSKKKDEIKSSDDEQSGWDNISI